MPGAVAPTEFKRITVRPLHPTFAAEIDGVDFKNIDDETFEEIRAAANKYGVVMFRSTGLDDKAHVEFSARFGDLDNIKRFIQGNRKMRYDYYELFDAGNIAEDGSVLDPESPRAHANRGNGLFHTDSSYNYRRASFSILRAVELPPKGTGGNTEFADSRTAFDELPEDVKEDLINRNYIGCHTYAYSRKMGSPEYFKDLDPTTFKMARHQIAQVHEGSGRVNLFIGAHLHHIEGLSDEKSAELRDMLNKHTTQPRYKVSIDWHSPSDMVIWDNRAVLHRAAGGSFEGKYRRDLRRTTVHDDSSTAWGLNDVGEASLGFALGKISLAPPPQPATNPTVAATS